MKWFLDRGRWWLTAMLGLEQSIAFAALGEAAWSALGGIVLAISLFKLMEKDP